jgi:hypothetical protein
MRPLPDRSSLPLVQLSRARLVEVHSCTLSDATHFSGCGRQAARVAKGAMTNASDHKFKVGQAVEYIPPRWLYALRGRYIVTGALPARYGEFEYRIRNTREDFERVATEGDLRRIDDHVPERPPTMML